MSARHTRRRVVTALAVAPLAGVAAALPAQAMTPLERIEHHLGELEAVFQDYYPDTEIYATFNGTTPEHMDCGAVPCVIVHAHLKKKPT